MTALPFQRIGLIAKPQAPHVQTTLQFLIEALSAYSCTITMEHAIGTLKPEWGGQTVDKQQLVAQSDLIIVVGGDGSLLQIAPFAAKQNIPVVGVNRGRLGFLTDIHPQKIKEQIACIFNKEYHIESRFLLEATVAGTSFHQMALNDVVLTPGAYARMVEFNIQVNGEHVCVLRADGLIAATPTGSTAYALSAGGPILHPSLDAIVLVPMLPHTLNHRPLVVSGGCTLDITVLPSGDNMPKLSCDGDKGLPLNPGQCITIRKSPHQLSLLHPKGYQYFATLREKLLWNQHS